MSETFNITINPVDDSLPIMQSPGIRVQEGVRKTITEFELKATDFDTEVRKEGTVSVAHLLEAPSARYLQIQQNFQHTRVVLLALIIQPNNLFPVEPSQMLLT